ncbi:MAG TPA: hypothetical protein VN224_04755 [Xanthomonadales bacterium]|nr:hypothetical protein [Xanthomonadales bacterium]
MPLVQLPALTIAATLDDAFDAMDSENASGLVVAGPNDDHAFVFGGTLLRCSYTGMRHLGEIKRLDFTNFPTTAPGLFRVVQSEPELLPIAVMEPGEFRLLDIWGSVARIDVANFQIASGLSHRDLYECSERPLIHTFPPGGVLREPCDYCLRMYLVPVGTVRPVSSRRK